MRSVFSFVFIKNDFVFSVKNFFESNLLNVKVDFVKRKVIVYRQVSVK